MILQNNGLTSFIAPCFSWELLDPSRRAIIATASELDLSAIEAPNKEHLLELLWNGKLLVRGNISEVALPPPANRGGRRFVITEIIGRARDVS